MLKILLMWRLTLCLVVRNRFAICCWVNHTVSSSILTSSLMVSLDWYITISPFSDSMLFIPLHVKFNFDSAARRRRSRLCPCDFKKDRHFSLFFQVILRLFYFFSPKGCYFPNYFVLLQMQPSRLRMIEAKDIRLRTVVLERTDRDEAVHILLIVRYISYD